MRYVDLGRLDGPLLLFGGPYSNAQATRALVAQAQARGIAPSRIICTGDVVAYCGDPVACVAEIRALGCTVIAGNCEVQLAADALDCGCGFAAGSSCDVLSVAWFNYASQSIDKKGKEWMSGLPDLAVFEHNAQRYGVLHGGVTDVAAFLWSSSPDADFAQQWDAMEAVVGPIDHIIAGHCGIPFVRDTPRGRWINAGVIGMPPHDGQRDTRFAILDKGEVHLNSLAYDSQAAAQAMQAAGLPKAYQQSLMTGYWPSEDILPSALRVAASDRG